MGRYLQAFKEEGRALVGRRSAPQSEQPFVQPYYDDVRPPAPSYGQSGATIDPAVLQALLQGAKAQGAYEASQASNDASADRIQALALAAINKQNTPVEIRYRGSAYDKKERRFGELRFAVIAVAILLLLMAIWWVKDQIASYADSSPPMIGQAAHAPPVQHRHYKRTEEYDDR